MFTMSRETFPTFQLYRDSVLKFTYINLQGKFTFDKDYKKKL